jgi:hypothetical protein
MFLPQIQKMNTPITTENPKKIRGYLCQNPGNLWLVFATAVAGGTAQKAPLIGAKAAAAAHCVEGNILKGPKTVLPCPAKADRGNKTRCITAVNVFSNRPTAQSPHGVKPCSNTPVPAKGSAIYLYKKA